MRFMIIVKASADGEAGAMPSAARLAEVHALHEELTRAGVLLDLAGLKAHRHGWRVAIGKTKELTLPARSVRLRTEPTAICVYGRGTAATTLKE